MHTKFKDKMDQKGEYRNIILQEDTIKEEEDNLGVGEEEDSKKEED
jgi:hypothetical protein